MCLNRLEADLRPNRARTIDKSDESLPKFRFFRTTARVVKLEQRTRMRIPARVSKTAIASLGILAFATCIGAHARTGAAHRRRAIGSSPSAAASNALRTLSIPGDAGIARGASKDRHRTRIDSAFPTETVFAGRLRFVELLSDATPRATRRFEKHPFRIRPPPAV
jgi:hypothetical protein